MPKSSGRPPAAGDPTKPRRQASKAALEGEHVDTNESADDTEVGMTPDPPPVKESEPDVDTYICSRCRGSVEHQQERCKTCGDKLVWS